VPCKSKRGLKEKEKLAQAKIAKEKLLAHQAHIQQL